MSPIQEELYIGSVKMGKVCSSVFQVSPIYSAKVRGENVEGSARQKNVYSQVRRVSLPYRINIGIVFSVKKYVFM
jgi:hypothetical protein